MHKVVRGIDVFDVGKEQLWRWCGWRDFGNCEPTMNNNACSLRKGAYVVIGNMAKFGAMARMPYVWEDCASLRAAVELVECFYESDYERYEMNLNLSTHIVDDYEIWHVVDDEELWGPWRSQVLCAECVAESDDALRQNGVGVHVYGSPCHWLDNYRCVFLELFLFSKDGRLLDYYRMPMDKASEVMHLMLGVVRMAPTVFGLNVAWQMNCGTFDYRRGFGYFLIASSDSKDHI